MRKIARHSGMRLLAAVVVIVALSIASASLASSNSRVATTTTQGQQTTSTRACEAAGTCKSIPAGNCPTSFNLQNAPGEPRDKNRDGFVCTRTNPATGQFQVTDNYVQ